MARLTVVLALFMGGALGCASQKAAPEPETPASEADTESSDRGDSADAKDSDATASSDTESKDKEATKQEASPPKEEAESKPAPTKKSCSGLKKSDCEVTVGCAWSSDKKCVDQ